MLKLILLMFLSWSVQGNYANLAAACLINNNELGLVQGISYCHSMVCKTNNTKTIPWIYTIHQNWNSIHDIKGERHPTTTAARNE